MRLGIRAANHGTVIKIYMGELKGDKGYFIRFICTGPPMEIRMFFSWYRENIFLMGFL